MGSLVLREAPSAMHSPITAEGDWPRGLSLTTDQMRGRSAGRWQPRGRLQSYPAVMASQTLADSAAAHPQVWCFFPVSAAWGGWAFGGCDERSPCVSTWRFFPLPVRASRVVGNIRCPYDPLLTWVAQNAR